MKIKVFGFESATPLQMENSVNNWIKENKPRIHKWMQSESSVYDLSSGDYPAMRTSVTITIVYLDEDEN